MKKILLMGAIGLSVFVFGQTSGKSQKLDSKKFDSKSTVILKSEIGSNPNLLDFKIDSIGTSYITRKDALIYYMSYLSSKSNENLAKYDIEKAKLESLRGDEWTAKYEELKSMLLNNNTTDKQLILLDKAQVADDKKKYVYLTTVHFYINIKNSIDGKYEAQYYYKPNGERIQDVYKYLILNP